MDEWIPSLQELYDLFPRHSRGLLLLLLCHVRLRVVEVVFPDGVDEGW